MSVGDEIDYDALIDRSIKQFRPVRRLWPTSARLLCWILVTASILGLSVWARGYAGIEAWLRHPPELVGAALFVSASIVAAFLALKSAIPDPETTWPQLAATIAIAAAALVFLPGGGSGGILEQTPSVIWQLFGLGVLPWLCLFWAVRRGVPLRPEISGAAVGLAAFCFAAASYPLISGAAYAPISKVLLILCGGIVVALSAVAGRFALDSVMLWEREDVSAESGLPKWLNLDSGTFLPLAVTAGIATLILVLNVPGLQVAHIPEFDSAIDSYQRALVAFHPNVPSESMETMLTAYVEHGMPAYMWDFSAEGFKLVGGRWNPLPDGTPVSYTWFRGAHGGVMCIFRQIEAFNPPSIAHYERHSLLFYRYHGYSFCLINVGGYGTFSSVIVAPMPLKQFEHVVLAATL